MLQICRSLGEFAKVLYVSGEESAHQLKLRAQRLQVESAGLFVLSETCLGNILECVQQEKPDILIVDSIQTLYDEELDSPAGGVGQVKDCTMALMQLAKGQGITVFVIGHVNKEGSIAGPKVLEHMVDCVLYFEGDQHMTYRILRAAKNRFGATNEIGVFEMMDRGLKEVENPSEMLLSGRPADAPGTCVTCVMEGARPVLAEVQALIAPSSGSKPLRSSNGFDYNRAAMLLAVLEKRAGYFFSNLDAYINVVGGLRLDEPAADLPVALSLVSGLKDTPVGEGILAFGEVGVRDRVKSVLHYRRPGVWLSAAAVLLCAALAMTFLTEPKPARTGVSPETASGQTDPDRLRETSSKALIVSSTLDPAAQRISYTVQLTEEPEDWIAQKQWYGVASYADVEIFYPEAGSYYRQTDVPHLRFYEWGLADQPTDLESQRPDTDTRYDDYIVDSVTVLSVDGVQRSTFRLRT